MFQGRCDIHNSDDTSCFLSGQDGDYIVDNVYYNVLLVCS